MTGVSILFAEARAVDPRERQRRRTLNARIAGEAPDEASPIERLADNLRQDIGTVCRSLAGPRHDRQTLGPRAQARLLAVAMRGALLDILFDDFGMRPSEAGLEATLALVFACKGTRNLPLEGRARPGPDPGSKPAAPVWGGGGPLT